jgi:hypothetical protein
LADNTYLDYIRSQYNRYAQVDPPFFQNFFWLAARRNFSTARAAGWRGWMTFSKA